MSLLGSSRCVLLVGDEALSLFHVTGRVTRLVETVPWGADNFEKTASDLVQRRCRGASVVVLNDMTDQHFKGGQRLPRVGLIDKSSVMRRKLQVAFPNYPIRGALEMKQTKDEIQGVKKRIITGSLYLFAAVPMSDPVRKTIEVVRRSLSSITGFFLLPVESADMVKLLAQKLVGKKKEPARWVLFLGQHQSGALRQIIVRDGQLAMTRMTPVIDTDRDFGQWGREVAQELKATVSYLTRFGYTQKDSAQVIVICRPEAGQVLEKMIDIPCQYTTFTVREAAKELGINLGRQDHPAYADALHAAWAGRKKSFTLPMRASEMDAMRSARETSAFAALLLLAGAGFLTWQLFSQYSAMQMVKADLQSQRQVLTQVTEEREIEQKKIEELGFDAGLVKGAIKTYEDYEERRLRTLAFIKKIDEALGPELHVNVMDVTYNPNEPAPVTDPSLYQEPKNPEVAATLRLTFPPTLEPEIGVREVNNLRLRLANLFPGFTVTIDRNVAGLGYSDAFSGMIGQSGQEERSQEYVAEITIKGEFKVLPEPEAAP